MTADTPNRPRKKRQPMVRQKLNQSDRVVGLDVRIAPAHEDDDAILLEEADPPRTNHWVDAERATSDLPTRHARFSPPPERLVHGGRGALLATGVMMFPIACVCGFVSLPYGLMAIPVFFFFATLGFLCFGLASIREVLGEILKRMPD